MISSAPLAAGAVAALDALPCTASAVPRSSLSSSERDELFALLSTHFDGGTKTQFARDLDEKDWVLRIRRDDRLVGFSTVQVYTSRYEGAAVNVVYSGDTIMDPEAWSSPVLARGWIGMIRRLQGGRGNEPWYWLLLSSGFRTYRFLPLFFRQFWPRYDARTPEHAERLLAHLARDRFGRQYAARDGIVRFDTPQRLRGALAEVPDGRRQDPHVAFFLERNPGHVNGDELVCLTELGTSNMTAAALRVERSATR